MYVEILSYLCTTYATDNLITRKLKQLEVQKQASVLSIVLYGKRLFTKALPRGKIYEEVPVMLSLVKGLNKLACDNMCVHRERYQRETLTELSLYENMLIEVASGRARTSDSSKDKPIRFPSRPSSSTGYAVNTDYNNKWNNPTIESLTILTTFYDDNC